MSRGENLQIGTYIGNVIVIQGDYKLRGDKMNVHVVDGKASSIDGQGNILFNSGIETASGDTGVYDLNAHTITLDGRVVLTKEKNVMRGTHLVMNLDTNKAYLTANATSGLAVTFVGLIVAFIPSRQVNSVWIFEGKLIAACLIVFGAALFFYQRALRRARTAPLDNDLVPGVEYGS